MSLFKIGQSQAYAHGKILSHRGLLVDRDDGRSAESTPG
jgi:hypothetical protein